MSIGLYAVILFASLPFLAIALVLADMARKNRRKRERRASQPR